MPWITNLVTGVQVFQKGETMNRCQKCNRQLPGSLSWGIVNGVAYCECGAVYRCYHRNQEGKVMNKEPTLIGQKPLIGGIK